MVFGSKYSFLLVLVLVQVKRATYISNLVFRAKRNDNQYMAKKLYIGGLAWATTDDSLRAHFANVGAVTSARVVTSKEDGRSRGFGFVEMENDAEADKAIETLNGTELDGRAISVSEARPQTDRPRTGGGFRGSFNRR